MTVATFPSAFSPPPPAGDVPVAELGERLQNLRIRMEDERLDVIVLSDKKNVEYFTDLQTLSWAYKARPIFVVVTAQKLVVVGSKAERKNVTSKARSFETRYYDGYLVEAVTMVASTIRDAVSRTLAPSISLDYGQDMIGRGSLELVETLQELCVRGRLRSAAPAIWHVRMVKSDLEIDRKRTAMTIVNTSFDQAIQQARIGMAEHELCQILQSRIFSNGAESADPIAMLFSKGDFIYCRPPGTRRLEPDHYVWTDFRATYGGYPADRNRLARAGKPSEWEEHTYTLVRDLTIELAATVRPGMLCSDVYSHFEKLWVTAGLGKVYHAVSRIGHGGGLDVTEPPSISSSDATILRPGMILHIEPKLERDGAVFQFEEVISLDRDGAHFVSDLSPSKMPVIF